MKKDTSKKSTTVRNVGGTSQGGSEPDKVVSLRFYEKPRVRMLRACVARFQSLMEPLNDRDRDLMMNALEDLNCVLCEECAEPRTATRGDTHAGSCEMTPESKQIVDVVDEFNEGERACMRDAILEIASLVRGKKKPTAQRKPAGNLIVVDFSGRCS